MKKYYTFVLSLILTLLLCNISWGDVPIGEAHFPDENLRAYINSWAGSDGILSYT